MRVGTLAVLGIASALLVIVSNVLGGMGTADIVESVAVAVVATLLFGFPLTRRDLRSRRIDSFPGATMSKRIAAVVVVLALTAVVAGFAWSAVTSP